MEKLVTTAGWSFIALIIIVLLIIILVCIQTTYYNYMNNRYNKIWTSAVNDVRFSIKSSADWLGSKERRPFQRVVDKIARNIEKTGRVNAEELRKEVDFIIKNEPISDGYHTHEELYEFRKMYNAALFNEWAKQIGDTKWLDERDNVVPYPSPKYYVHKSLRHHDGELCFGGGWFIVVALLPTGQISNHYQMEDWDLFKIPETEKALYEFDGHTGEDVLERLKNIL